MKIAFVRLSITITNDSWKDIKNKKQSINFFFEIFHTQSMLIV